VCKITIAIDGYSSCGKSTLARALAHELNYVYIDSGAMYRAVTYYLLQHAVSPADAGAVEAALTHIRIRFDRRSDGIRTLLNEADIEMDIRRMEVSERVSEVAAIPAVRRAMVAQQRDLGAAQGIVMDGRDIGTVVFPDAQLKLFLTADVEERVRRRYQELSDRGLQVDRMDVHDNLEQRDRIDSTREDSPLRQAQDAVVLDTTNLSRSEQLAMCVALARERIRSAAH